MKKLDRVAVLADRKVIAIIDGYATPLVVLLVGAFPFNGFNQVVLLVVDADD